MNMHVPPILAAGELRVVSGDTFAEMAAEYQSVCNIVNDEKTDEDVADAFFGKACEIEEMMTQPGVPMSEADIVLLARLILAESCLESGLDYTGAKRFVMKLLNSITANG